MKIIFSILSTFMLSLAANAAHHEQAAGMNLDQLNAVQMQMCKLKPGKTMADYQKMSEDYIRWSQKHDAEVMYMRATPLFASPRNSTTPEFDFIEMLASSFEQSGQAWKKWLSTKEGQKLNDTWQSLAECRGAINRFAMRYADIATLHTLDERVITFEWCTRNEGVAWDDLAPVHQQAVDNRPDNSSILSWAIMFPGVGVNNAPGEFLHMFTFADTIGLMAHRNRIANEEGWRQREDYQTNFASCTGQNAYLATVLNRPSN